MKPPKFFTSKHATVGDKRTIIRTNISDWTTCGSVPPIPGATDLFHPSLAGRSWQKALHFWRLNWKEITSSRVSAFGGGKVEQRGLYCSLLPLPGSRRLQWHLQRVLHRLGNVEECKSALVGEAVVCASF